MLYKIKKNGLPNVIEPVGFKDFAEISLLEKDLENLIAKNLFGVLYESNNLLPICQERQGQAISDIYALDRAGNLVIFELKRSTAGEDAVTQILKYAQDAGRWTYSDLENNWQEYEKSLSPRKGEGQTQRTLLEEHKDAFELDVALEKHQFNVSQRMILIGNAAEIGTMTAVDYWRRQGLSIDFLPYRVYELPDGTYFEFFALPFDFHRNPSQVKGVLFDTCRTHIEEGIWYMTEGSRVAAFGDIKYCVDYLNKDDYVFFYHRWVGIVAAAKVTSQAIEDAENDARYCRVKFLTDKPVRGSDPIGMPPPDIRSATEKNFFWARTIKVPYLDAEESEKLLASLKDRLEAGV